MALSLRFSQMPRADDVLRGALVLARLGPFGRLAPGRHRMASALCTSLAAAMRMIDWVHRRAAHGGPAIAPDITAGFGENFIHVIGIRHRTNRGLAFKAHPANFARIEPQQRVARIAAEILRIRTGGPCD